MGVPATAPAGLTAIWLLRKEQLIRMLEPMQRQRREDGERDDAREEWGSGRVGECFSAPRPSAPSLPSAPPLPPAPPCPHTLVPPHLRTLTPPYPLYQRHEAQHQRDHRQQSPRRIRVRPQAGRGAERDPGSEAIRPPRGQKAHSISVSKNGTSTGSMPTRLKNTGQRMTASAVAARSGSAAAAGHRCARAHGPAHRARHRQRADERRNPAHDRRRRAE